MKTTEFHALNNEAKAVAIVHKYLSQYETEVNWEDIKIVWFCKTLQNWKAMIAHLDLDGMFFEVTFNGNKQEIYLDAYAKHENRVFDFRDL